MSIITLLVLLILIGVGLYLVNTLLPMDAKIKMIINIVVILVVILWLLNVFGLFDSMGTVPRIGHGRHG